VRRLSVEDVPQRPRAVPNPPNPAPQTPPVEPDSSTHDTLVATLRGIGFILAPKALMLVAVIFVFTLALYAMREQTLNSLLILCVFTVGVILPLVLLDLRRGRGL
jgi:hypothetical protein